jgi:hypothetical protein
LAIREECDERGWIVETEDVAVTREERWETEDVAVMRDERWETEERNCCEQKTREVTDALYTEQEVS